jgi:transcriptional regulator with XRE-family HTH domain
MKMTFTVILNDLIKKSGMTLGDVAKGTGMAKSTLHNLMNGTEPSLGKVRLLSEFFGVSLDYLANGKELKGSEADPLESILKASFHKGVYEVTIKKITP